MPLWERFRVNFELEMKLTRSYKGWRFQWLKHGTIVGCLQEGCIKELYNVNGMYSPLAGTWYIYMYIGLWIKHYTIRCHHMCCACNTCHVQVVTHPLGIHKIYIDMYIYCTSTSMHTWLLCTLVLDNFLWQSWAFSNKELRLIRIDRKLHQSMANLQFPISSL